MPQSFFKKKLVLINVSHLREVRGERICLVSEKGEIPGGRQLKSLRHDAESAVDELFPFESTSSLRPLLIQKGHHPKQIPAVHRRIDDTREDADSLGGVNKDQAPS